MKINYVVYYVINYVILFVLSLSISLSAQQQVRGIVIDTDTKEAMPFVNIAVVGSTYGTVSNQNGEFTLNLERIGQNDSIAFYYIGYKTFTTIISKLIDGMIIKIKEKPVKIRTIAIIANPYSPKELIQKALERREANYPRILQKREVFTRSNKASYINTFDIRLKKSNIPTITEEIVKEMVDSIPRYNRSYADHLYTLYGIPLDTTKAKHKIEGIKHVILKEDNGGELDRIEKVLTDLFDDETDDNTFWKYRTGILSFKESHVEVTGLENDSLKNVKRKRDSIWRVVGLYNLRGDFSWEWDFIQKPGRYTYKNQGIIGIGGEDAFALSFSGILGADYQGMIYISLETYAILRIEYSLRQRKSEKGIKLLGVNFNEETDTGLWIYGKDEFGYFPKYTMSRSVNRYGVKRSFEIIRKQKRALFNKKLYSASLDLNLQGYDDSSYETLVIHRDSITNEKFSSIQEKAVKPERITSYSDSIWEGYSIIEPTKQMKEYKAKIKN